jgi:hypothetical protein
MTRTERGAGACAEPFVDGARALPTFSSNVNAAQACLRAAARIDVVGYRFCQRRRKTCSQRRVHALPIHRLIAVQDALEKDTAT